MADTPRVTTVPCHYTILPGLSPRTSTDVNTPSTAAASENSLPKSGLRSPQSPHTPTTNAQGRPDCGPASLALTTVHQPRSPALSHPMSPQQRQESASPQKRRMRRGRRVPQHQQEDMVQDNTTVQIPGSGETFVQTDIPGLTMETNADATVDVEAGASTDAKTDAEAVAKADAQADAQADTEADVDKMEQEPLPTQPKIPCLACRRFRIRCCPPKDQNLSPCDACIRGGRHCQYPSSSQKSAAPPTSPPKLRKATTKRANASPSDDGPDWKRARKQDSAAHLDPQTATGCHIDDVLSAPYLTEPMWAQLFKTYSLHFASELPFLHIPTLKDNLRDRTSTGPTCRPSGTSLVLLGVLVLTCRFHPSLVKAVSRQKKEGQEDYAVTSSAFREDAWAASQYYAGILIDALGPLRFSTTEASIERVQAYLMLGLYERNQSASRSNDLNAWMYIGAAIRMAQALHLHVYDRLAPGYPQATISSTTAAPETAKASAFAEGPFVGDTKKWTSFFGMLSPNPSAIVQPAAETPEAITDMEIRRRTMFSCFILDRMLMCGDDHPMTIRSEDLMIRLPCSEFSFDFSENTHVGFFQPAVTTISDTDKPKAMVQNDSMLARFVCLVDIWGEVARYHGASSRRLTERLPPWDAGSAFQRLRVMLEDFTESLPPPLLFSRRGYHRHENQSTSGVYVSLHMLLLLCEIVLHRGCMPDIPVYCHRPTGPRRDSHDGMAPPGFWEKSAEQVFKAARRMVDIVELCHSQTRLPMSTLAVFSTWTAASVGLYAWHFPFMDVRQHMLEEEEKGPEQCRQGFVYAAGFAEGPSADTAKGSTVAGTSGYVGAGGGMGCESDRQAPASKQSPTRLAFAALKEMACWLPLARKYVRAFHGNDKIYWASRCTTQAQRPGEGAGKPNVRFGELSDGPKTKATNDMKGCDDGSSVAYSSRNDVSAGTRGRRSSDAISIVSDSDVTTIVNDKQAPLSRSFPDPFGMPEQAGTPLEKIAGNEGNSGNRAIWDRPGSIQSLLGGSRSAEAPGPFRQETQHALEDSEARPEIRAPASQPANAARYPSPGPDYLFVAAPPDGYGDVRPFYQRYPQKTHYVGLHHAMPQGARQAAGGERFASGSMAEPAARVAQHQQHLVQQPNQAQHQAQHPSHAQIPQQYQQPYQQSCQQPYSPPGQPPYQQHGSQQQSVLPLPTRSSHQPAQRHTPGYGHPY